MVAAHTLFCGAAVRVVLKLPALYQKVSLRSDWAEKLLEMAEADKEKTAQSVSAFVSESQIKIRAIQTKLQRLLEGYLEQDIEREIYREQKQKLLLEKKSLDEKMARIEQKQNDWLEPALGFFCYFVFS